MYKEKPTKVSFSEQAGLRRMQLAAEIGHPLKTCFEKTHHGGDVIVRSILPIIEMLSTQNKKNKSQTTENRISILKNVGIIYPEIFWYSARHGLMHNSIQKQALKIRESENGVLPSYNWDQKHVSEFVNGCYTINPKLLYESVMSWLEKCQANPPYETIQYTYILEVIDESSELYKEIATIQNS